MPNRSIAQLAIKLQIFEFNAYCTMSMFVSSHPIKFEDIEYSEPALRIGPQLLVRYATHTFIFHEAR